MLTTKKRNDGTIGIVDGNRTIADVWDHPDADEIAARLTGNAAKLAAAEALAVALAAKLAYEGELCHQPLEWRERFPDIEWCQAAVNSAARLALRQWEATR